MHPKRKQRLMVALVIVVLSSATIGLIAYALSGNINLFYSPSEVASGEAPIDRKLRVGGMVVEGSVERASDRLETRFQVTDFVHSVTVTYDGILPDLFAEERALSQRESSVLTVWLPPVKFSPSTTRTTCRLRWLRLLKKANAGGASE